MVTLHPIFWNGLITTSALKANISVHLQVMTPISLLLKSETVAALI